jgi:3-hydroxyacyl-CoA dehydrogenase
MDELELHRVAVIGGGMMGRSIATRVSQAGLVAVVCEITADRAAEVKAILTDTLDHGSTAGRSPSEERRSCRGSSSPPT